MGYVITLVILILLAILPLGVSARYDGGGAVLLITAGPVRYRLLSGKKEKKEAKKKQSASAAPSGEEKGGDLMDFLPMVEHVLELLGAFRRKLRVTRLCCNVVLAGDDPCDLAVNYGKAWAALGSLWPRLEALFVIKKRDVKLQCDFEATKTLVTARLDVSITLGRLLALVAVHGTRALREFITIKNKGKGGAAT